MKPAIHDLQAYRDGVIDQQAKRPIPAPMPAHYLNVRDYYLGRKEAKEGRTQ